MFYSLIVSIKVCTVLFAGGWLFRQLVTRDDARWLARPAAMMPVLYALGMFAPNVWVMYLVVFATVPLLARDRADAVALYLVTMLSVPAMPLQYAGFGVYFLVIDKWLFGALGLLAAVLMKPARGGSRTYNDVPFYILLVLEMLEARGLGFTETMRGLLGPALTIAIAYFLISRCLREPAQLRRAILAISFCGFCLAVIALFEAKTHLLAYTAIEQHLGVGTGAGNYAHVRSGLLRAVGSFPEAIGFGLFLSLALMATLALRDAFRTDLRWYGAMGVLGLGVLATNSRSALVAFVLQLLAFDLYRRRYASLAAKIGVLGMAGSIALMVAQVVPAVADRLGVAGAGSADTVDYRRQLLSRGIQEILQHPFGTPVAEGIANLSDLRQGEGIVDVVNGYIRYGIFGGVFGSVGLLVSFLLVAGIMMGARRRLASDARLMRAGAFVFAIAASTIVTAATCGFGGRDASMFYNVFAIGMTIAALRRDSVATYAETRLGSTIVPSTATPQRPTLARST